MWKTIVLCAALFFAGAVGLAAGARWIEPAALPALAAIGLCLIGIVLILLAPGAEVESAEPPADAPTLRSAVAQSSPSLRAPDSNGSPRKKPVTPVDDTLLPTF
jgi:hypothetical protein